MIGQMPVDHHLTQDPQPSPGIAACSMDDVRVLEALEQLAPGTVSALTDDLLAQRRHMRAVECLATRQQDLLSSQLLQGTDDSGCFLRLGLGPSL